ncbi:MAG: hypothetical protein HYR70_02225 [Chloroflexi bacterium]|nr:hypothetical protein [Chloroflexota bacterium]MBI1854301.1 hypothetical protein [Chloroflexota bacterium]MBI3340993.1 hypothetical protein [Chloroflexota bacterium]
MNIKNFIKSAFKRIWRRQELPDEVVQGFMRVLDKVRKEDTTCKEVFDQLDEYVEKEVRGEDAALLMPLLREHLDICSDCCEEYEALLNVLQTAAKQ